MQQSETKLEAYDAEVVLSSESMSIETDTSKMDDIAALRYVKCLAYDSPKMDSVPSVHYITCPVVGRPKHTLQEPVIMRDIFVAKSNVRFDIGLLVGDRIKHIFDIVDLSIEERMPEYIQLICEKCFELNGEGDFVLKSKYKIGSEFNPTNDHNLIGISPKLSEELIRVCKKRLSISRDSLNFINIKYHLLGKNTNETLEQCIDNAFYTGRAERLISTGPGATGPCVQETIIKLIKNYYSQTKNKNKNKNKKKFALARVHVGKGKWNIYISD